jgi:type VI secretion system protein
MALADETLFERLLRGRPVRDPSMSIDRARLRRSIAANLERLLSSREGHAPAQPDYGMPDAGEVLHAWQGGPELVRKRLKQVIETYEPRLQDVKVLQVQDVAFGQTLRYSLRAQLRGMPQENWAFELVVQPTGRLRILE